MNVTFKNFNQVNPNTAAIERWNTRYGVSTRIVKRTPGGQFASNVSVKQLVK